MDERDFTRAQEVHDEELRREPLAEPGGLCDGDEGRVERVDPVLVVIDGESGNAERELTSASWRARAGETYSKMEESGPKTIMNRATETMSKDTGRTR